MGAVYRIARSTTFQRMPVVAGMRSIVPSVVEVAPISRKRLSIAALGAVLVLAACRDDNGPNGDTLSAQEQAALLQALSSKSIVAPGAAVAISPLLSEAQVGSMGEFSTVGSQLKLTLVNGTTSTTTVFTSVTGWAGLDAGAKTVDSAITVASIAEGQGTFPSTVDADLESGNGYASYFDGTDTFFGETGVFHMTSSSFGTTEDCPNVQIGNGLTSCRIAFGTMSGNFDFAAVSASDDNYTRGNTSFSVPAVQLSITLEVTPE
jgi:hypothetical protein